MTSLHAPNHEPRQRPSGAQRGNQNARKHGRYSRLRPANRTAYLRKVLRGYGFKDTTTTIGGIPFGALAAESNTHLKLVLAWLQTAARLAETQAPLAEAQGKLNQR